MLERNSKSSRPYVLSETNWKAVKDQKFDVAVLPWGATEVHNYHLPYGTDNYESTFFAIESARKAWEQNAKVMSLPVVPFGINTGQMDIPFVLNIYPSTQSAILEDVVESLSENDINDLYEDDLN